VFAASSDVARLEGPLGFPSLRCSPFERFELERHFDAMARLPTLGGSSSVGP
jgi:hypothetical protein